MQKGALLDLLTYNLLQNFKKLEGEPYGDNKKFSKSHSAEKNPKGKWIGPTDPLGTSGFVGFLEKVNQSRICGKGVGLGIFPSESLQSQLYEFIEIAHIDHIIV